MSAVPAARPTDKKPRSGGSGSTVALSRNGQRALTVFFVAFLVFLYVPTRAADHLLVQRLHGGGVPARRADDRSGTDQAFATTEIRTALLNSLKVATRLRRHRDPDRR